MKHYTQEKIEGAYQKIGELLKIVSNLEEDFPGRHFTLDGHLIGSIGEIMAAYYYGIELYEASAPIHDGITEDGKEVQVKITQQDRIVLSEEPQYLIVLHLDRISGKISEIYNGKGKCPWECAASNEKRGNRSLQVSKLAQLDVEVPVQERIPAVHYLDKYKRYQSHDVAKPKKTGSKKKTGSTLIEGYVNKNKQINCGCTGKTGNHEGQKLYSMRCLLCGCEYEANGCDVWLRKCPACM